MTLRERREARRRSRVDRLRVALAAHPDAPPTVLARCSGIGVATAHLLLAELVDSGEVAAQWSEGLFPRRRLYRLAAKEDA